MSRWYIVPLWYILFHILHNIMTPEEEVVVAPAVEEEVAAEEVAEEVAVEKEAVAEEEKAEETAE